MSNSKFTTRSFSGKIRRHFTVEPVQFSTDTKPAKAPSHLILCIDRSGSRYSDIASMRSTLEKILTLQEFNDPSLRVSLITTSSKGDVTLHFRSVSITDVMAPGSKYIQAVRSIQASCMTCLSQALALAETLVDDSEVTGILFDTDGFANDSSPSAEARDIDKAIAACQKHPRLFVNTIAYGGWCDYNLMSRIANSLSGVCVQARDIRQVYEALHKTTTLLAGTLAPAVEIPKGNASFVTFVSKSAGKVLGSDSSLQVQGLSPTDDKAGYRYTEVNESVYNSTPVGVCGETESTEPVFAYARAQLARGNLNEAKYALVSTRQGEMLREHAKALVNHEVQAFAAALEGQIFQPSTYTPTSDYGLAKGPSVLSILDTLNTIDRKSLEVNYTDLMNGYKRRGVRRVEGVRKEDGTLETPTIESRVRGTDGWVPFGGVEINRNTASVNLLVSRPLDLFARGGNLRIASVAGIPLDNLKSFNNVTIVGDGVLCKDALTLRITNDKGAYRSLSDLGVVTGDYVSGQPFRIDLSKYPLVDFDQEYTAPTPDEFRHLAALSVLDKILSGMTKGETTTFTSEQVADLKTHYLTPSLNFSPPTTTEYTDLQVALATGKVDIRLSYKIDVGVPGLTSISKLKSGNEYLQRRFTATLDGKAVDKPTLDLIPNPKVVWGLKKLTAATKMDEVDEVSFPIYEGILGFGDGKAVKSLFASISMKSDEFLATLRGGDKEAIVSEVARAKALLDSATDATYGKIRPLVFYIGSAGSVPDSLGVRSFSADDFAVAYPTAKLSKIEKEEGTFFVTPSGVVLTVYIKGEYFSPSDALAA